MDIKSMLIIITCITMHGVHAMESYSRSDGTEYESESLGRHTSHPADNRLLGSGSGGRHTYDSLDDGELGGGGGSLSSETVRRLIKKTTPRQQSELLIAVSDVASAADDANHAMQKEGGQLHQLRDELATTKSRVQELEEELRQARTAAGELGDVSIPERETPKCCYKRRNSYGKKECGGNWSCCLTYAFSCFCGKRPTIE